MDLMILGPSNSGKTYLANFLASKYSLPIFNCDSVQIYKYLNSLTSKPKFSRQEIIDDEVISHIQSQLEFQKEKYNNINFVVYIRQNGSLEKKEFDTVDELFEFIRKNIGLENKFEKSENIKNFLFDIRNPSEKYSTSEFENDLKRISEKFEFKNKIIVGGTIYYAFNYLLSLNDAYDSKLDEEKNIDLDKYSLEELIYILKKKDPKTLDFIDIKNRRRVENAVKVVIGGEQKYSSEYFRSPKLKDNFLLILLKPKDREKYYKSLDEIIDKRFNQKTLEEIDFLIKTYGEEIITWLQKVSYEYRYFLKIHDIFKENNPDNLQKNKNIEVILQELKYKEHQYTKRQITFVRRLERLLYNT